MAHTDSRAVAILRIHSKVATITSATIDGVAESDMNPGALKWAQTLLQRFPIAVQLAATKSELEDSEMRGLAQNVEEEALNIDVNELTADNLTLTRMVASLENQVTSLEKDNAALQREVAGFKADIASVDPSFAGLFERTFSCSYPEVGEEPPADTDTTTVTGGRTRRESGGGTHSV